MCLKRKIIMFLSVRGSSRSSEICNVKSQGRPAFICLSYECRVINKKSKQIKQHTFYVERVHFNHESPDVIQFNFIAQVVVLGSQENPDFSLSCLRTRVLYLKLVGEALMVQMLVTYLKQYFFN